MGNPPTKFKEVFAKAKALGIKRIAHAGEEGPADYITQALDELNVCRIDHGVAVVQDEHLMQRLTESQIALTVCPLSNTRLKVFEKMTDHSLPVMLENGLKVTLNSDDPAYFGGGMLNNFLACAEAFAWDKATFKQLAKNAIDVAFMSDSRREELYQRLTQLS